MVLLIFLLFLSLFLAIRALCYSVSSAALLHAPVNEISSCRAFVVWSVEVNTELSRLPKSERPNLMHSFGTSLLFCTRQSNPVTSCRRTCSLVSPGKLPCISTGDGLLLFSRQERFSGTVSVVLRFAVWSGITLVASDVLAKALTQTQLR